MYVASGTLSEFRTLTQSTNNICDACLLYIVYLCTYLEVNYFDQFDVLDRLGNLAEDRGGRHGWNKT